MVMHPVKTKIGGVARSLITCREIAPTYSRRKINFCTPSLEEGVDGAHTCLLEFLQKYKGHYKGQELLHVLRHGNFGRNDGLIGGRENATSRGRWCARRNYVGVRRVISGWEEEPKAVRPPIGAERNRRL